MMGHAGMAAAAVRYLRAAGSPSGQAAGRARPVQERGEERTDTLPPPDLRAVRADERAPVDPAVFRRVLGGFASGVTVVTAPAPASSHKGASEAGEGVPGPAGFACQSFASLSLEPPLVSFMVARTSKSWPGIARAGVFCVNVLSAAQGELCRAFAVSGADKFAGVSYSPAPVTGSPLLEGVTAWIDCEIHAVHTGGDHLIVVGRVRALDEGRSDEAPLVFHQGRLGTFTPAE
ncbi:flavin reductase family protein [Streptomyces tubbatahanensis]|uniref:Flavin reductase family protein n=1 Tax=Streptomyces tubbatahanensis TaxID=2923272 RepID=A0ABY3XTC1_9ACTN|nr:flavin reductase family protein [Streptomyces tubbatahanensis]UNS97551.1 flavin reductase family protein [Streptomyces tubbatahanensis]